MLSLSLTIEGIAAYSQSKKLDVAKDQDESHDDFENRIWRQKAHVGPDGDSIVIPGHAVHQMLVVGAQKGRLKPKAAKSAREGLANRLVTGIAIQGDADTDMKLSKASVVGINAHVNGKRGSGSRVVRKFPEWPTGWHAHFDVLVLDDSLTAEDIEAAAKWGGLVCGLGRFRPQNMGHNGRHTLLRVEAKQLDLAA